VANIIEFILKLTGKDASKAVKEIKTDLEGSVTAAKGLESTLGRAASTAIGSMAAGAAGFAAQRALRVGGAAAGAVGGLFAAGINPFQARQIAQAQAEIGGIAGVAGALAGPTFGAFAGAVGQAGGGVPLAAAESSQAQLQALAAEYAAAGAPLNRKDLLEAGRRLHARATRVAESSKLAADVQGEILGETDFKATVHRGILNATKNLGAQAMEIAISTMSSKALARDIAEAMAKSQALGGAGRPGGGTR